MKLRQYFTSNKSFSCRCKRRIEVVVDVQVITEKELESCFALRGPSVRRDSAVVA